MSFDDQIRFKFTQIEIEAFDSFSAQFCPKQLQRYAFINYYFDLMDFIWMWIYLSVSLFILQLIQAESEQKKYSKKKRPTHFSWIKWKIHCRKHASKTNIIFFLSFKAFTFPSGLINASSMVKKQHWVKDIKLQRNYHTN